MFADFALYVTGSGVSDDFHACPGEAIGMSGVEAEVFGGTCVCPFPLDFFKAHDAVKALLTHWCGTSSAFVRGVEDNRHVSTDTTQ